MSAVYAFLLLEKEIEFTRKANQATEARLRVISDQYDIIFASLDTGTVLTSFISKFEGDMDQCRGDYEYVIDLDGEHLNVDESIDKARNDLEKALGSLHRRLMLFARINNVLTAEVVKDFYGKYRGSMNPGSTVAAAGGENLDRKFA